eukprot:g31020.t1
MDQCAVSAVAISHIQRCQEIGAEAQLAEEALLALVKFLQLLRAARQEGASQDGRPRSEEEEETRVLQDRALELDKTLAAVKICLVDGSSGERTCCQDLVSSLGSEAAKLGLGRQPGVTQEELHQAFCTRQSHLIKDVQEIEKRAGALWLNEATFPGVQR